MLVARRKIHFGSKSRTKRIFTLSRKKETSKKMSIRELYEETWHEYGGQVDQTVRLDTFEKWPKKTKRTPEELSQAGFFYKGKGLQVFCFSCGQKLYTHKRSKWQKDHDLWMLHAQLDPECAFMIMAKGTAYIHSARKIDADLCAAFSDELREKAKKRKAVQDEKQMENEPAEKEMKETSVDQHN